MTIAAHDKTIYRVQEELITCLVCLTAEKSQLEEAELGRDWTGAEIWEWASHRNEWCEGLSLGMFDFKKKKRVTGVNYSTRTTAEFTGLSKFLQTLMTESY